MPDLGNKRVAEAEHGEAAAKKADRKDEIVTSKDKGAAAASSASAPPPLPRIPTDESCAATPAKIVMSAVVPWVLHNLREHIKANKNKFFDGAGDKPLHEHQPLLIVKAAKDASLRSYKAPWDRQSASNALATTGMYEAAGNIVWARLFTISKEMEKVSGTPVLWQQVVEVADQFFSEAAYCDDAAKPVNRIMFPITMFVNAPAQMHIAAALHFNSCLDLITGHAFLYAWWFAMFKALRDDAATLVASLWQCGLTATIHLRKGMDTKTMATLSCQQSELNKAAKKTVSDSFPAFALKALLIAPSGQEASRTQALKDSGVRYNNSPVQKVCVACSLADRWFAQPAWRAATPPR
jgi:hypothetical protein